jgi:hypothetical protein
MELIKQIEAILEARNSGGKAKSPAFRLRKNLPTDGDARFELASLRKNG